MEQTAIPFLGLGCTDGLEVPVAFSGFATVTEPTGCQIQSHNETEEEEIIWSQQNPLLISVIMQNVMQSFDTKALWRLRNVCHIWNSAAVNELQYKTVMKLSDSAIPGPDRKYKHFGEFTMKERIFRRAEHDAPRYKNFVFKYDGISNYHTELLQEPWAERITSLTLEKMTPAQWRDTAEMVLFRLPRIKKLEVNIPWQASDYPYNSNYERKPETPNSATWAKQNFISPIECFSLMFRGPPGWKELDWKFLVHCPYLKTLGIDVSRSNMSECFTEFLHNYRRQDIKVLKLWWTNNIRHFGQDQISTLAKLVNALPLHELHVGQRFTLGCAVSILPNISVPLKKLRLQTMPVYNANNLLYDGGAVQFLTAISNGTHRNELEALDLEVAPNFFGQGVPPVPGQTLQPMVKLRTFKLRNHMRYSLWNLTENVILTLPTVFPNLVSLDVNVNRAEMLRKLLKTARLLESLQTLVISSCRFVRNRFIIKDELLFGPFRAVRQNSYKGLLGCATLRHVTLELGRCNLSARCVEDGFMKMPFLQTLKLSTNASNNFDDTILAPLKQKLTSFETLT